MSAKNKQMKSKTPIPNKKTEKKKRNRQNRRAKLSIQASGFGMQGSLLYEKVKAPAAMALKGRSIGQRNESVAGDEIVTGSTVLFSVPLEDSITTVRINPGLSDIFPQLSPTAGLFSEYIFEKLVFRYIPRVGTSSNGQVGLAFNSNVQSPPPGSFTELVSYEGATYDSVWDDGLSLVVTPDCGRFTRKEDYPPDSDPKTFDCGSLTVLLDGYPGGSTQSPGFIQADYVCRLMKRVLEPPLGCEINTREIFTGTSFLAENFFRASPINPLIDVFTDDANNTYLGFPAGYWSLEINVVCDAANDSDFSIFTLVAQGGGTGLQVGNDVFVNVRQIESGILRAMYVIYNPISAIGNPLEGSTDGWWLLDPADAPSGLTNYSCDTMICRVPPNPYPNYSVGPLPPKPLGSRRSRSSISCRLLKSHAQTSNLKSLRKTRLSFIRALIERDFFTNLDGDWINFLRKAELIDVPVKAFWFLPELGWEEQFQAINGLSDHLIDLLVKAL